MRTKDVDVVSGPWKGPGGPRVLVENPDFAIGCSMQQILIEEGFDVAVCEGPDRDHARRCPLVASGECRIASGADVIVQGFNLDRPDLAEVLRAQRQRHPSAQIVVEVPEPAIARHQQLLDGCSILRFPATRAALTEAVEGAIGARTHGVLPGQRKRWQQLRTLVGETEMIPTIMTRVVGPVTNTERAYAEEKVARLLRHASTSVPHANLELRKETDPGWTRPALAKVTTDVDGRRICIHADATTMFVAVDALVARLRRGLDS